MGKCIKCGNAAIREETFFFGSRISLWGNTLGLKKLEGASIVGVCGNCAKSYFKKEIIRGLLYAFGALAFGLCLLIIALTQGLGGYMWLFVVMVLCLGGSIKFFLTYRSKKRFISENEVPVKEIDNDVLTFVVYKSMMENRQISKNVIF